MAALEETEESELLDGLVFTSLLAVDDVVRHGKWSILVLARPLESLSPSLVAKPVADIVGIAGIDEDRDVSFKKLNNVVLEGKHPIAVHEETAVDVHVARVI